jgi:queuosine precursor transporter
MTGRLATVRGFIAAALSQIVDTLIFITVSFYGVRPIADLMLGQMLAKIVLSAVMVPVIIALVVRIGRKLDAAS